LGKTDFRRMTNYNKENSVGEGNEQSEKGRNRGNRAGSKTGEPKNRFGGKRSGSSGGKLAPRTGDRLRGHTDKLLTRNSRGEISQDHVAVVFPRTRAPNKT